MRITRDSLLQSARSFVTQQLRKNRRMVCIYLAGSLLSDDPLLGSTTDIDLFFVHDSDPVQTREIVELADGVHFDIAHLPQSIFRQPRELRTDPWIAPSLCNNALCLHDTQHWFEFTQASVCAQYSRPDYVLQRAQTFANESRKLWMALKNSAVEGEADQILTAIKTLEKAANAIATLSGNPLTERRFLVEFPPRAEAIGRPGLASGLVDIIMRQPVPEEKWASWLAEWEDAFLAAGKAEDTPAPLHPVRLEYFKNAVNILRKDHPAAALWPVLRTWTLAARMENSDPALQEKWKTAVQFLGLDPENPEETVKSLDTYLDNVEETLDLWAEKMGISPAGPF